MITISSLPLRNKYEREEKKENIRILMILADEIRKKRNDRDIYKMIKMDKSEERRKKECDFPC